MKRIMILLSIVGLLFAAGAEVATAQSVHPQDVLDSTLAFGDPWGPARSVRCQAALLHGWHNPGEMPSSCVALMTSSVRYERPYNNRLNQGGFFNRQRGLFVGNRGVYQSSCIGNNCGSDWEYVAGTIAQAGFSYMGHRSGQETIRQGQDHTAELEHRRIDLDMTKEANDYTIRSGREERTNRRLDLEIKWGEAELEQFKDGRYDAKEVGWIPQEQVTEQRRLRVLYNNSPCQVALFHNGRIDSILYPGGDPRELLNDGYQVEAQKDCSIDVKIEGDDIYVVPGR